MMKKIVFIDMNPAMKQIPIYQLGICFLGGIALEKGWNIEIIEYHELENRGIDKFSDILDGADCLAVSIRNIDNTEGSNSISYLDIITEKMNYISEKYSNKTVVGGAGFSILPGEILKLFNLKYGIVGRGGETFANMLDWLAEGGRLEEYFCECIVRNKDKSDIYKYEKLANIWKVMPYIEDKNKRLGFDTHIGCNGHCIYCTYPGITKNQRCKRNGQEIQDFIITADRKGIHRLQIVDDTFNSDLEYSKSICKMITETEHHVNMSCYLSPMVDEEFVYLLKQAGIREVVMGVDSLSDDVLRKMNKGFTEREIFDARKLLRKYDISVAYTFIVGSLYETANTLQNTEENIIKHMPDRVTMQYGIRIYPNTLLTTRESTSVDNYLVPKFAVSPVLSEEDIRKFMIRIKEITNERKML